MRKLIPKNQGQLVIEALLILPLVLWLSGLGLDLVRRAEHHLVFAHITCLVARERVLGRDERSADELVRSHLSRFWGGMGRGRETQLEVEEVISRNQWEVAAHIRYPAFFRFPWQGKTKHHMEASERCSFPIG